MYTVEKKGNLYKIKITIEKNDWENYINEAYEEEKNKYNIQGFRKGKAPRKVIEQNYGNNIFFETAVDIAFSKEYYNVLGKETQIQPIDQPKLSIESFDDNGLVIVAEVESMPEVKLGKYKGLEVEEHKHELDEAKIEKEINQARERRARFINVEREAKMGDVVTIDFVGSMDGKEFEGGKAENHRLELGSKTFIDTFEQQIVSMKVGEKRDIKVNFPKEYGAVELAGKPAVFAVMLTKVEEKELPEINDAFASEVSEFETMEEYRADIRKNLQASLDEHLKTENENNLLKLIVDDSTTEVPDVLVNRQLDMFIRDFELRLSYQNIKMEDYLNWSKITLEQLKEERKEQAKETVKTRLVLEKLIETENLFVSEKELDEKISQVASKYKKTVEDYKKSLGEKQLSYFENEMLMDKVFDFLKLNNKFTQCNH